MATSTTDIVNTLGAGSGIDIKALAKSLVEVEQKPLQDQINKRIQKDEAQISGYGALKYALTTLGDAFQKVADPNDFTSIAASNSQPSAFKVMTTSSASAGSLNLEVTQVAQGQQSVSAVFNKADTRINGNQPVKLNLTIAGKTTQITSNVDTPEAIVAVINAKTSTTKVSAQLVDTGSGVRIMVNGPQGASNSFNLTADTSFATRYDADDAFVSVKNSFGATSALLNYNDPDNGPQSVNLVLSGSGEWVLPTQDPPLVVDKANVISVTTSPADFVATQPAQDATFKLNGLNLSRSTNTINGVLEGVSFELYAKTSGSARVDLNRDNTTITQNMKDLVNAFNEFSTSLDVLADPKSEVEGFGGALAGVSLLQRIKSQMRRYLTDESSTPGTKIKSAIDAGLSFDRNGKMKLDEDRLNTALSDHFDEVVKVFTAGTNNKSVFSTQSAGVAGDAIRRIDQLTRSTGVIQVNTKSVSADLAAQKLKLEDLQSRMDRLLSSYLQQFAAMDSIVSENNSLSARLEGTFKAMQGGNN